MTRRLSWLPLVVVLLLTVTGSTAAAPAAPDSTPPTLLLVLDASGSMWGQVDGTAKIQIAKDTLGTLIDELPTDARVGLMAYGHRRDKDCDDIELLVPVAPLGRDALKRAVAAVKPKGMTPIERSLRRALDSAPAGGDQGELTIVLVSDGKETCDPDPCAAVAELKRSGVKFVAHVIGFDVGADERRQLACIAEAAGGKYYAAANAAELRFATRVATGTMDEAPASGDGRVWIDPPAVAIAGGTVTVHFEAAPTFHQDAWLGVVPSDVPHGSEQTNDEHDLSYDYIRGRTGGTVILPAPSTPGRYDIRLHDADHDGREVASASFEVQPATGRVWVDGDTFTAGARVQVHYESPQQLGPRAWIGLVPAATPHGSAVVNDEHDVAYDWVRGEATGTVSLTVPADPGRWEARLFDSDAADGRELAAAPFTVVRAGARVWLDGDSFPTGTPLEIHFEASSQLGAQAWLGLVPADLPHGSAETNDEHDVAYQWVADQVAGNVTLTAPSTAGRWDARLNDGTGEGASEIASASFTLVRPTARVWLDRQRFAPGDEITIHFEVSTELGPSAWIGLVPADVPHGSADTNDENDVAYDWVRGLAGGSITLTAPEDPGRWDARLNDSDSDGVELASASFSVE